MSRSKHRGGGSGESQGDRDAFREAFADVRPLVSKAPKRVMPAPEPKPVPPPSRRRAGTEGGDPLRVEHESNGIVVGRRQTTHASIIDTLEDPRLEVEAECDLHGLTAREAEGELLRFVRNCQQSGRRWVLVIVGKGLHSPGGRGALKGTVIDALAEGAPRRFVLAFRTAPRHLGGTGAIVVRLVDHP